MSTSLFPSFLCVHLSRSVRLSVWLYLFLSPLFILYKGLKISSLSTLQNYRSLSFSCLCVFQLFPLSLSLPTFYCTKVLKSRLFPHYRTVYISLSPAFVCFQLFSLSICIFISISISVALCSSLYLSLSCLCVFSPRVGGICEAFMTKYIPGPAL